MEPIFTIPYGEYAVAEYLKKHLKNISVFVPTSRQEKGVDIALIKYLENKNKVLTIQVKQSRSYEDYKVITDKNKEIPTYYGFWFRRYTISKNADWHFLVGVYPKIPKNGKKENIVRKFKWSLVILAFRKSEIVKFMNGIVKKKDKYEQDNFFDFHIDQSGNYVYQVRGTEKPVNLNIYKIENRIKEVEKDIEK